MSPKILDQQSLKAREQEILDAAISLIQDHGVEHLTMDKIVAQVSFSKGTVYKHFIGKEDVLLAIGNQAITILADLFWRAAQFEGCARERMLVLNFSYLIYALLHPQLFQTVVCSKSANVYAKASETRRDQQQQLEYKLLGAIHGIIEDALTSKNLVMPEHLNIKQLCFANWSMCYGTISLLAGDIGQCEGRNDLVVERELFNQSNLLFDGMQWQPLSEAKDYNFNLKNALTKVFPKELLLLEKNGLVLDF